MMEYKYFVGKFCTVFTVPVNRNFQSENPQDYPKPLYRYFMGVVEAIDRDGVLLTQATTGLKSYFFRDQIVCIAEEQLLDPSDPEDAKIIAKMEAVEPPVPPAPALAPESPYVDPEGLLELCKQLKQKSPLKR